MNRTTQKIMANVRLAKMSLFGACMAAFTIGSVAGCEQDPMFCLIASGYMVSTYEVVSNDGSCEPLLHDGLATAYHLGEGGDQNRGDPYHGGMSLIPGSVRDIHNWLNTVAAVEVTSEYDANFGKFTTSHPVNGSCEPEEMSTVEFSHPEVEASEDDPSTPDVDESMEALPAGSYRVDWSGVKLTVTPALAGTYLEGDLTVEQPCGTTTYSVRAFSPAVHCESDADCEMLKEIDPSWKGVCVTDLMLDSWNPPGYCALE
jgi:hypothetical protein